MENNSTSLPPIFKFSMIWNILPYFGYLHTWKKTLESLCMGSRQVWRENYRAFIKLGSKFKDETTLCSIPGIYEWHKLQNMELHRFRLILYTNDNEMNVKCLYESNDEWTLGMILSFLFKINEDLAVVFKSDNFMNYTDVEFWRKSEISEILPSVLWPSCKSETKRFHNFQNFRWAQYILKQVKYKSVVVRKIYNEIFEVIPIVNSEVYVTSNQNKFEWDTLETLKTYQTWKIRNWIWRPLALHYINCTAEDKPEKLLNLSIISNIKHLVISRSI